MISVFSPGNVSFDGNGDVVLMPLECKIRQVAGGAYDLTLKHPIDPSGKWMYLTPEAIIRAPIPPELIESAYSGMDVDVYKTVGSAPLRSAPSEPTPIYYAEWNYQTQYSVGSRVSCTGWRHRNYQCTAYDGSSPQVQVPPYNNPSWWKEIPDSSSGAPVMVTLPAGTSLYFVENAAAGWYKVSTLYGLEGYIKTSDVVFDRHLTPSETQPHTITEQLFRIKTVSVDTKSIQVSVTAEHVSYDLRGIIVRDVSISQMSPAMALAWIESGFTMAYQGTIATNMTSASDGTISEKINGKNAVFALLDPDQGIVARFNASCRRDNWDWYIMRKTATNRGFKLRYAQNMLGVSWKIKSDQLVTRVMPVAKNASGGDLFLYPTEYIDSPNLAAFPVIRTEWLKVNGQVGKDDGSGTGTTWTESTLRAEMRQRAQQRFDVDKADQLVHEITIDFEQLGDTVEFAGMKGLEQVLLYDTVTAIDERIRLSVTVEVTELEWDAIRKKVTALKLSNVAAYAGKNVSGFNVLNNSITGQKLTDDAGEDLVGSAVDQAVEQAQENTTTAVNNMNSIIRQWVTDNFEPISQGGE